MIVFQESPHDTTEYAGFDVEFRCRHARADEIGWLLNGTSLSSTIFSTDSQLSQHCPVTAQRFTDQLQSLVVNVLIIRAAVECNRTEVQCAAYFFDGQQNDGFYEVSEPAILTVKSELCMFYYTTSAIMIILYCSIAIQTHACMYNLMFGAPFNPCI